MKKTLILFFIVASLSVVVFATLITTPAMGQDESLKIEANPNPTWFGNTVNISCWYTTNITNVTNPWVFISKTGQNFTLSSINSSHFLYSYNPPEIGTYEVYCSNGTVNSSWTSFKVSKLAVNSSDIPEIIYLGDSLVIHANVVKTTDNEEIISSGASFKIFLDSNEISINNDSTRFQSEFNKWNITTNPISDISAKNYTLSLNATYSGKTVTFTKIVQVKNPIEFEVVNIDKTWVKSNETITITIKATEKGNPITPLKNSYLKFEVNLISASIIDISQSGDLSFVKILTPELASGSYELKTTFTYKDDTYIDKKTISYIVPVTGKILDSGNKPVYVQMKFSNNENKQTITTSSDGSYSSYIPPGIYDLQLIFPSSTLHLTDVMINNFDDPIRFDHPTTDVDIPGIKGADIFVYEIALTYSNAQIEMKYDDSKISDETKIDVYRCKNLNFGKRVCNGDWSKVKAEIDTIRDLAKVNVTSLSAFVIGTKESIYVDFASDKETYNLKEPIKIKGLVKSEDGSPMTDVNINATIQDTEISDSTKSDSSGVFSLEFLAPDEEGDYKLVLTAEKSPSAPFNKTVDLNVVRSKELSILMTDTIRIEQGENKSVEVSIINTGQTDFSNLTLSFANIPDEYYNLTESIDQLLAGVEKKIWILFSIPEDAPKTTYSGKISVASDDTIKEQSFALTILPANKTQTVEPKGWGLGFPAINFPTANIVLPAFGIEALYISFFGVTSFSVAYWLKKKKLRTGVERTDIKNFLLDIKREISRVPIKKEKEVVKKKKVVIENEKIKEEKDIKGEEIPRENEKVVKDKNIIFEPSKYDEPSEDNIKFRELFNLLEKTKS